MLFLGVGGDSFPYSSAAGMDATRFASSLPHPISTTVPAARLAIRFGRLLVLMA